MDPRVDSIIEDILKIKKELFNLKKPEIALGFSLILPSQTLTGSEPDVTFSSIPQNFTDLKLIIQARTDAAAESDNVVMQFNSDTGANYDRQRLSANNATVSAAAARAGTGDQIGEIEAANSRASNFAPIIADIIGYSRTDAEKWTLSRSAAFGDVSADADLELQVRAGRWRSTAAITSIVLSPVTGPNFVSGSRFYLYGIR